VTRQVRIAAAFLLAALALLPTFAAAETAESVGATHLGSRVCRGCHLVQYLSWERRAHGKAFESLRSGSREAAKRLAGLDPAKDYTNDSLCLPCHATGYGEPGGFVDPEETPELLNVGCESCHGAGSLFVEEVMRAKYSFAHAEVLDRGYVLYADHDGHLREARSGNPPAAAGNQYAYTPLGDPPLYARRYRGELLPLDPKTARHCTDSCHNEDSPTHTASGIEDFEATFEERVKKGVHRRYGLKFIHW